MSGADTVIHVVMLGAAVCFVAGLHLMNSPATARKGNRISAAGMVAAVLTTAVQVVRGEVSATSATVLAVGLLIGGAVGLVTARRVQLTAMPQLVSVFNAVGGGAAALIAIGHVLREPDGAHAPMSTTITVALDVLIGAVTFTGSLIAAGKLAGLVPTRPLQFRGARALSGVLVLVAVAAGVAHVLGGGVWTVLVVTAAAAAAGVLATLPIGGADMPVVVSLLNALTGLAVAMAGFVLGSSLLIIAGALVGAAGGILTKLMADAMNRPILAILMGGFGGEGGAGAVSAGMVKEIAADDAALQLAYARSVVIVPGYGLAAAQAQHEAAQLAEALRERGVAVNYGIHPVAGRMPGHMNVLLAEANVPYDQLKELEEINPVFPNVDVVLVVGANDTVNPAARRAGNAVSGMPILDVDKARSIIVIKRSLGQGYAGVDNELYTDPRTALLFGDAKAALAALLTALRLYVG